MKNVQPRYGFSPINQIFLLTNEVKIEKIEEEMPWADALGFVRSNHLELRSIHML